MTALKVNSRTDNPFRKVSRLPVTAMVGPFRPKKMALFCFLGPTAPLEKSGFIREGIVKYRPQADLIIRCIILYRDLSSLLFVDPVYTKGNMCHDYIHASWENASSI